MLFKKWKISRLKRVNNTENPRILFQFKEIKGLCLEDILRIPLSYELRSGFRIEASMLVDGESMVLGSVQLASGKDDILRYNIKVSTADYFWDMGIATMMISLAILYLLEQSKEPFYIFLDPMDKAMEIYRTKRAFVYHHFIKEKPNFDGIPPKKQEYNPSHDNEKSEMKSLFCKKQEYLISNYKQVESRYLNPYAMEKSTAEIRKSHPEILEA